MPLICSFRSEVLLLIPYLSETDERRFPNFIRFDKNYRFRHTAAPKIKSKSRHGLGGFTIMYSFFETLAMDIQRYSGNVSKKV